MNYFDLKQMQFKKLLLSCEHDPVENMCLVLAFDPLTNVWNKVFSLEAATNSVVNTFRFTPFLGQFSVSVRDV